VPQTTTRPGLGETLDNQRIMKLVEEALCLPEEEREPFLKQQCESHPEDFAQAMDYVEWEQRMQGFLLEPVIKREEGEPALQAGDLLQNRFRIVREVAQGGMGVVYEAQDEKLGRRIALKCAKAGFGNELPPEVRHATEVSHPNVCKLYEIHTATIGQRLVDFITMEFLEGEMLSTRLKRGLIPRPESFVIARQLAAGVAEAHRNGVIHGDIKSNNVILTKSIDGSLRAVVTDFGLARREGGKSRGIWGTPGYMAPELWLGEQPSVASDIYALGVVFFEMATGEIPSQNETSKAVSGSLKATPWLEAVSHKPPPVSPHWDGILGRCLDPDPQKRYKSADELALALTPGHARRNTLLAVAALTAVALTGVITYRSATAPTETVKLAVVPAGDLAGNLVKQADKEIGRLEGTKKIAFELLPAGNAAKASRVLTVSLDKTSGQTAVHAVLSDPSSQATLKTWDARYSPAEWKYAPRALAGVVSAGLHLTPLADSQAMNEKAQGAYKAGTNAIRQDSDIDAVLRDLESAVAADQDSPLVFAALAEAEWLKYFRTNDNVWLERARDAERECELRYLDTASGHRAAARQLTLTGRYEDAEAELLRAVELEPGNAENYRRLGLIYRDKNQVDKASLALGKAVEIEPDYYRNQWSLGKFYLDSGRYKQAVAHLLQTVQLLPSASRARNDLVAAYTDTGQFEEARRNLDMANLGALGSYQLATILMYEQKDAEAIRYLLDALRDDAGDAAFLAQLAIAERHLGRLAESKKTAQRGLALVERQLVENPRDAGARSLLGYFCAQLGQRDRAQSETQQAFQLDPSNLNVRWLAVATYEALGMRADALAVLHDAPPEMLADLKRWPDLADLTTDTRFIELTKAKAEKKEKLP